MKKCCAKKKGSFLEWRSSHSSLLVFEDFKYNWRPTGIDFICGKWWVTFMFL